MVSRTRLIGALIGFVMLPFILCPGPAGAGGTPRVGVIISQGMGCHEEIHQAFVAALKRRDPDRPLEMMVQRPAAGIMAWRNAARRFEVLEVDLIVVYGASAALAVQGEVSKIPVVYAAVSDPEGVGLKGRNVTGVRDDLPLSALIRYLHTLRQFKTLGVLYSSMEPDTVQQAAWVENLAETENFSTLKCDLQKNCADFQLPKVDALLLTSSCVAATCAERLLNAARQAKIPSAALHCGCESQGVILSICGNPEALGAAAARTAGELLEGHDPESLNVTQNHQNEMIINVREARNLNLNIPVELLMSATRLIK